MPKALLNTVWRFQNNPYPEASSKTETDLKSDVIPLHFRNQKGCEVVELLTEQCKLMTSSTGCLSALAQIKTIHTQRRVLKLKLT